MVDEKATDTSIHVNHTSNIRQCIYVPVLCAVECRYHTIPYHTIPSRPSPLGSSWIGVGGSSTLLYYTGLYLRTQYILYLHILHGISLSSPPCSVITDRRYRRRRRCKCKCKCGQSTKPRPQRAISPINPSHPFPRGNNLNYYRQLPTTPQ